MHRDRSSRRRRSASRRKTVQPEHPCGPGRCGAATPASKPRETSAIQREQTTKRRGELAELAFALKAASLGFGVSRPWGDSERYDFILDADDLHPLRHASVGPKAMPASLRSLGMKGGKPPLSGAPGPPSCSLWRVQVKGSAHLLNGLYQVSTCRHVAGRIVLYTAAEIDFFAAYIIPEDTWYILPIGVVASRPGLLFRRKGDRKPGLYDAYREAWHLLRQS